MGPTNIIVILTPEVDSIHIHTAVIRPVVRQSHDELDPDLLSSSHDFIKRLQVDSRLSVIPPLENHSSPAGAFASILRESVGVRGHVAVVETPCAEDIEAGPFGRCKPEFDVGLVLLSG